MRMIKYERERPNGRWGITYPYMTDGALTICSARLSRREKASERVHPYFPLLTCLKSQKYLGRINRASGSALRETGYSLLTRSVVVEVGAQCLWMPAESHHV